MNPKHFTTIRHSLPAQMCLTIWPSVLHLKTGRFRELNMLAKKLWHADERLFALKELRVGWFRSSCVMLVLLLSFTPRRASANGTIQHIPNIHTESMTIFHVQFISATYSTLWSWACLQIYWYNIIQSLSYTPNVCQFTKYVKICLQQRFGTKLIFQSWRIEWFWMILRWFTSKLARSSGHNGGHTKWISCLLWSRGFRSCGLWASDPRVTTDFWWEEFSESFGKVCLETSGYFCWVCL